MNHITLVHSICKIVYTMTLWSFSCQFTGTKSFTKTNPNVWIWLIGSNNYFPTISYAYKFSVTLTKAEFTSRTFGFELGHLTSFRQRDVSRGDTSKVLKEAFNIGWPVMLPHCIHRQMPFPLGTQNEHRQNRATLADPQTSKKYMFNFECHWVIILYYSPIVHYGSSKFSNPEYT